MKEKGVDFGKQASFGNTPLMWAIANAYNTIAMEILNIGEAKEVNSRDDVHHNTALHLAIGKGYKNVSADNEELEYSNADLMRALIEKERTSI